MELKAFFYREERIIMIVDKRIINPQSSRKIIKKKNSSKSHGELSYIQ
mgnify:CR=1 FL=1